MQELSKAMYESEPQEVRKVIKALAEAGLTGFTPDDLPEELLAQGIRHIPKPDILKQRLDTVMEKWKDYEEDGVRLITEETWSAYDNLIRTVVEPGLLSGVMKWSVGTLLTLSCNVACMIQNSCKLQQKYHVISVCVVVLRYVYPT